MPTPVLCSIRPGALRVRVPRPSRRHPPKPPDELGTPQAPRGAPATAPEAAGAESGGRDAGTSSGSARLKWRSQDPIVLDVEPLIAYWDGGRNPSTRERRPLDQSSATPASKTVFCPDLTPGRLCPTVVPACPAGVSRHRRIRRRWHFRFAPNLIVAALAAILCPRFYSMTFCLVGALV